MRMITFFYNLSACIFSGCVLAAEETDDHAIDNAQDSKRPEPSETKDEDQKRYFGNVLSSGFKMGKKEHTVDEQEALTQEIKKWYYGNLLGKGFKAGKRFETDEDNFGEELEEVDLEGPTDDKRNEADLFRGRRFALLERSKRDADKRFIHYFGRGLVLGNRDRKDQSREVEEDSDDSDEDSGYDSYKPYYEDMEYFDESGDLDDIYPENEAAKRYIGSNPGNRFKIGKRPYPTNDDIDFLDEAVDRYPYEKRGFGHVLGHGFAFGKRATKKRPFGYVLGRGFSFGKRSSEGPYEDDSLDGMDRPRYFSGLEDENEKEKRMGLVLGRGFLMGKRGSKRFGWILGRGLKFGKRSGAESGPVTGDYFIDDDGNILDLNERAYAKRFGHILGSGFAFGKRHGGEDFQQSPEKRQFGYMLGRGFRLGRR